jgi:A/G-specific adenine glycosylase
VLAWYRPRETVYPWRTTGRPDPYGVLVSEIMLQQTQASRVISAYTAFLRRFPTVRSLAEATRGAVIQAWGSLGYNRRAVALFQAARRIDIEYGGRVPSDPETLQRLPGVGPYTAAAVSSIAFNTPIAAVDTNVRRVIARFSAGGDPEAVPNHELRLIAERWLDRRAPGAWNQAVMDLGREVCRPVPRCDQCPLASDCRYRRGSTARARLARRPNGRGAGTQFDGSFRQLRGGIVAALRERSPMTIRALVRLTGRSHSAVVSAVNALACDGLVRAEPAALAGRPTARVALFP